MVFVELTENSGDNSFTAELGLRFNLVSPAIGLDCLHLLIVEKNSLSVTPYCALLSFVFQAFWLRLIYNHPYLPVESTSLHNLATQGPGHTSPSSQEKQLC